MNGIFSGIIKKRRRWSLTREGYFSLLCRIVLMAVILCLTFTKVFFFAQAQGNDMFPAVKDGDLLLGFCLEDSYQKDDVVWYKTEDGYTAGRVIAIGGDVVTVTEDGKTLVNGTDVDNDILYQTDPKEGITYPYTVPEGEAFILGDYRTQAIDSRDLGSIRMDDIKGKILTILRRRGMS